MSQLILEVPDALMGRLGRFAVEQKKSIEQMVLEQLAFLFEPPMESLGERYERFFNESSLFIEVSEDEKRRYQPVSEERLKELAAKLGAAGPLSELIISERGEV